MAAPLGNLFVQIGGDTKAFNEALRDAVTKATEAGVTITKAGKGFVNAFNDALNPTQQLGQQLALLEKAGKSTGDIMAVMGDKVRQFSATATANGQAIDPTVAKYKAWDEQNKKTGLSIESLGKLLTDFAQNPIGAAKAAITGMLTSLGPVGVGLAAVGAAAAAAGAAVFKFTSDAAENAERLENLSAMTGMSVQELQAFERIAEEAGLSGLDLGRMIGKLNEQLGDTKTNEFTEALQRLGISTKDAAGQTISAVDALDQIRVALLAVEDPTQRNQMAQQLLGGRLRELIPIVLNSESSLSEMKDAMIAAGIATDEVTHRKLLDFDRQLDEFGRMVVSTKNVIVEWASSITGPLMRALAEGLGHITAGIGGMKAYNAIYGDGAKKTRELTDAEKDLHNRMVMNQGILADQIGKHKEQKEAKEKVTKAAKELHAIEEMAWQSYLKGLPTLDAISKAFDDMGAAMRRTLTDTVALEGTLGVMLEKEKAAAVDWADTWKGAGAEVSDSDKAWQDEWIARHTKTAKETESIWAKQVSTIVTDLSKGFADILFEAGSWGEKLKDIFVDIAKSIVRSLVETLFTPLKSLLTEALGGLIGIGTGGGSTSRGGIGGAIGGSTGSGGLIGGKLNWGGMDLSPLLPALTGAGLGFSAAGTPGMVGGFMGGELLSSIVAASQAGMGAGAGLSGFAAALGAIPVWGWAALAGIAAIGPLAKLFGGKDAYKAGSMEAARDFGGIDVPKSGVEKFFSGLGLSESQSYPIRKDLLSSPAFLTSIGWPMALAQNKIDPFLASLASVGTSWGSVDLQSGFIDWLKSGNAANLNSTYEAHFAASKALQQNLPNWRSVLMAENMTIPSGFGTDTGRDTGEGSGEGGGRGRTIPGAATGGYVAEGGAVIVHRGETIVPAGRGTVYNVYIDAPHVVDTQGLAAFVRDYITPLNTENISLGGAPRARLKAALGIAR